MRLRIPRLELRQRRGDIRFAVLVGPASGWQRPLARPAQSAPAPRREPRCRFPNRVAPAARQARRQSRSARLRPDRQACIRLRRRNANARCCSRPAIRAATSRRIRPRPLPRRARRPAGLRETTSQSFDAPRRWRKRVGVEPTKDRLAAPPGFEVRTPHRGRFPSTVRR